MNYIVSKQFISDSKQRIMVYLTNEHNKWSDLLLDAKVFDNESAAVREIQRIGLTHERFFITPIIIL